MLPALMSFGVLLVFVLVAYLLACAKPPDLSPPCPREVTP